jgi:hypothetical protein
MISNAINAERRVALRCRAKRIEPGTTKVPGIVLAAMMG